MNRKSLPRAARTLLLSMIALLVGSAGAQQSPSSLQSYDVELLIFRHVTAVASNEVWNLDSAEVAAASALTDEEGSAISASPIIPEQRSLDTFPALSTGKYKLNGLEEALRRNRAYQVLAHIGWTQPGYARTDAHYLAVDPLVNAGAGLTGRMALTRGRYLHLALDMTFQAPADPQPYALRQTRRMRSNERHYIDHPKFGVLALIVPSI